MSEAIAEAPSLAVGDQVQLVSLPSHVKGVAVGAVGTVLVTGLPFGACSVVFGAGADPVTHRPPRFYQVRSVHLRRISAGGA